MKKIIVFSDSHRNTKNMIFGILAENPDLLIHCGDGDTDLRTVASRFPGLEIKNVRGNCDRYSSAPLTEKFVYGGKRFFVVHGHNHCVKQDTPSHALTAAALEKNADIVLYGHTHVPYIDEGFGFMAMNPGTCKSCPSPSYGVITIDGNSVLMRIEKINAAPES